MSVVKKAKYRIDNGTDFDVYHFETDAQQVTGKIVSLDDVDLVTEPGFLVDALAVKELNGKIDSSYEDLTEFLKISYGWNVTRLECIRQGRIVHLSFSCNPSDSWQDNCIYTVLTSTEEFKKYLPKSLKYSAGVGLNGDGTGSQAATFSVDTSGNVKICTSQTRRQYYACNMAWSI